MSQFTIDREIITSALDAADMDVDETLHETYSGRGMYGDLCFGIAAAPNEINVFLVALGTIADNNDDADDMATDHVLHLAESARTDQLGTGSIVYFPGWQLS